MKNLTLEKLRGGGTTIGFWINLTDGHAAEGLGRMAVDWLCFDLQHGLITPADLLTLIPVTGASKASPIVRVISNDPGAIGRALDCGAHGVIIPLVSTPEQAAQAVAACKYPPEGIRSCGPMRGAMLYGPDYLTRANDEVACIVMIETREGLDNVEAIAAVPGVDVLFIGPTDLCYGLDITPGDFSNPLFIAAVNRIKAAARASGPALGLFGYNAEIARQALDDGFTFVSIGTEMNFLRAGANAALETVNSAPAGAPKTGAY